MRAPSSVRRARRAQIKSFAAPTAGWIASQNRALPDQRGPGGIIRPGAEVLENWFPTATGARMRAGSALYATVGSGDDVKSLFSYSEGNAERLFAATETSIYDITTVIDPTVSPSPAVSGLTGGDWIFQQFATSGGTFIRGVNGVDTPRVYDAVGLWSTTPAITGVTASSLNYVWAFKQRLFFAEKDTLNAWYLPVDSIGGAATKLPLAGVFKLGGSILFGASWSIESGSGLADQCVFFTTEGEAAVYQGSNPASAAEWQLVGVYRIGRPLGKRAWIKAGGDIIIATDIGLVPLSQAIQNDPATLAETAGSRPIETAWNTAVANYSDVPWHCVSWPTKQMVMVAAPSVINTRYEVPVGNLTTGAWGLYTGWNVKCLHVFGDRCFFGSVGGKVVEAEVTGSDQGSPYVSDYLPLFNDFRSPASLKIVGLARAVLLAPMAVNDRLSVQRDFTVNLPAPPDSVVNSGSDLWGAGIWGTSVWGVPRTREVFQNWRSVSGSGYALSIGLQITSGSLAPPDIDLVRIDMTYDEADIVT